MNISADMTIKPVCCCYLNSETEKTIGFTVNVSNIKIKLSKNDGFFWTNVGYENAIEHTKWYLRFYDGDNIEFENELTHNPQIITHTFTLPENSKKEYIAKLIAVYGDAEYECDSQIITILRQKYCHSIKIDVKLYDLAGNELDKILHPTSADWDESLYSNIKVKINITNEQGNYVDIPINEITTNWQYQLNKIDIGRYEFTIPNTGDSALGLGNYGIAIYINKEWTETNGYLNSYLIDADNVYINDNKIKKVMYIGDNITKYENGITYLNNTYKYLNGIFINLMKEFEVIQQLETTESINQYTFCYTPFIASQTLNLPTYTDDEKIELIQAIMRELGRPRKKETFGILTKDLPKINQSITLIMNSELRTIPIYGLKIRIANKQLQINISNGEQKLLKDYLSMLK